MLHSVLSPETCANCRNCCIFEPQSAWELPLFSAETVLRLNNRPAYKITAVNGKFRIALPYDASNAAQPCPFLNPESGCTLPDDEKPFACKIWPVRIMRDDSGTVHLTLYRGCPGIPAEGHEALDALLKNGLRDRIFAEAERDPSLILPAHPNYENLGV